jgi:hypothetical protein
MDCVAGVVPAEGTEMKRLIPFAAAVAVAALAPWPAAAQDQAGDRVNVLDVYGNDPCPQSSTDEIVVCRRLDEGDRYRIPKSLRESSSPANESWARRVQSFEAVGDFGALSCSPVGAGGELGCTAKAIAAAFEERRTGFGARAGELIAAAREERLSTIDAEAAATQGRVEELERQYMERVRREQEAELPGESPNGAAGRVVEPLAVPPGD